MIIDIHCHTAGIGAGNSGCFISPELRKSWKYKVYLNSFGVQEHELLRHGDSLVLERLATALTSSGTVDLAVVLAMDGALDSQGELDPNHTEMYIPNDFLAEAVRKHPNLRFGASINPYRRDALEQLDKAVAAGAVLMKWLPSIQHIDLADKQLVPFYQRMQQHGLPLLTHTGDEASFTYARNELGDPQRLHLALEQGVTVIAAHAAANGTNGGEHNFSRFLRLCDQHPNLHADISALTQINRPGQLRRLIQQHHLHGRLHYGTDMPLTNTPLVSPLGHLTRLAPWTVARLMTIKNPWDRDLELKRALGVPEEVFTNPAKLLRI
ncbi:MAG: amidohydrolase family protein [Geobacteraceae bacterium]|nr:amidohydrolase family protein [Geobacteraceae bacterium]